MKLNKLIIKLLRVFSVFFFKNTVLLHFIGDAVIFIKFFKNRTLAAFIAVLLCAGVTYAAEPSLSAIVMPEKGTVGQPMTYTLTISGINPDEVKIVLPEKKVVFPDKKDVKKSGGKSSSDRGKSSEEFVPLYIINSAVRDESEVNGNRQIHVKIILSYFRPGNYTLPEIKVSGNDGISIGYKIPVVIIEEINAEGNLEEIEPPVSIGGNYTRLVLILVLLVLIAAAAVSVYFYFKKRKKPPVALEPALPPIEIFLNAVESMKLRELPAKGRINEYVFGISIIFRRYLSSMLMFDAAEMTTDEIAIKIKKYMPAELYAVCGDEIISNMRLWDFSKFAEFTPSAELLIDNLDAAISAAKIISGMGRGENGTAGI